MKFVVEGAPSRPRGMAPHSYVNGVSPEYFETLGIALRQGRLFRPDDGAERVALVIINESMARQLWPGQSPLGKRLAEAGGGPVWGTIVGVVVRRAVSRSPAAARHALSDVFPAAAGDTGCPSSFCCGASPGMNTGSADRGPAPGGRRDGSRAAGRSSR